MKFLREATAEPMPTPSAVADWVTLTKLRIGIFVFFAAWVGGVLAMGPGANWSAAIEPAFYILLVGAGSSIFNQVVERETDGLMDRTRDRPLPTGRVSTKDAIIVGAALGAVGTLLLAIRYNALAALLLLGTLVAYSLVYTLLKRQSTLNTMVGAIPGAMPPLLGYVAIAGNTGPWGWHLFLLMFVWQFPHFMAIAWLFRADYAKAGMRMLTSLPNSDGLAGSQAVLYGLVLIPVSLYPGLRGEAGIFYLMVALGLGLMYLAFSLRFALKEDRPRARALLFASLIYLPLVFLAALADPIIMSTVGIVSR
ncbi:MAG: heme o synthase [Planctomycetota bacterium]|jgi:heme o synthase|nr:heme o synthase [Planctomycetota bacterium]MDG2142150.1 heme o synthase [Planctomycetota bacterium]